jgi:hypothetical protein
MFCRSYEKCYECFWKLKTTAFPDETRGVWPNHLLIQPKTREKQEEMKTLFRLSVTATAYWVCVTRSALTMVPNWGLTSVTSKVHRDFPPSWVGENFTHSTLWNNLRTLCLRCHVVRVTTARWLWPYARNGHNTSLNVTNVGKRCIPSISAALNSGKLFFCTSVLSIVGFVYYSWWLVHKPLMESLWWWRYYCYFRWDKPPGMGPGTMFFDLHLRVYPTPPPPPHRTLVLPPLPVIHVFQSFPPNNRLWYRYMICVC